MGGHPFCPFTPGRLFVKKLNFASRLYELFSSMRFAVALLSVIAIASVIGTVLRQNEPYPAYLIEFGAFWFEAWRVLGLYDVYHAAWFLLILAFLVLSTSLCLVRHTPGFVREMRAFRERARRQSLLAMSHHYRFQSAAPVEQLPQRAAAILRGLGYRLRVQQGDGSVMVAGKAGSWQRLGYFMAHMSIVMICVGGLMDGNLTFQVQEWLGYKQAASGQLRLDVPASSRLPADNASFRGNIMLAEGERRDAIFLQSGHGFLVQELPFTIELKKFYIDHYSTGQPKRFASDIVVTDKSSGERIARTIEVNSPLTVRGITIYQASFDDGGSALSLHLWDGAQPRALEAVSLSERRIELGQKPLALELGNFRLFNIEAGPALARQDKLTQTMAVRQEHNVQNVGPSITYKLRDATGQGREFQSYMAPVPIGGRLYWVTGVRDEVGAAFRYLQVPLDSAGEAQAFMRLRAHMLDTRVREDIAGILAGQMLSEQVGQDLHEPFRRSVQRIAEAFAADGFAGLERLVDSRVPAAQRPLMQETNFKILLAYAWQAELKAALAAGVPPPQWSDEHARFLADALQAMSDWTQMRLPGLVQLKAFDEVKASGLQLTRSPGKPLVYLGSLLLVLGTLIMFYVRERRVWIRLQADEVIVAMSANRRDETLEIQFERMKTYLPQWLEEDVK